MTRFTFIFFLIVGVAGSVFAKDFRVGLVLDKAGKDDKSFNASACAGGERAKKELGVSVKTIEPPDESSYALSMETLASRGFDLVIGVGFAQQESLQKVAARFPQTHFAIVDATVNLPNVASLLFEEQEGSYLVGMIAGMKTKSNVVGFVGGMDIPMIRRFEKAYIQGVQKVNPKAKVISNFAGVTSEAWADPTKGKELANAQISQKADVIYQAAGATGLGVFDAAEAKKVYAIGTDSNQNWVKPGTILTSMLKRVDVAVFETIKDSKEGKFTGGVKRFNLKNGGIDYALDSFNDKLLTADIRKVVDDAKKEIIAGKLSVIDYYKKK